MWKLSDILYEECDEEISNNWDKNITIEQRKELDRMVNEIIFKWIEKNDLQPSCFTIDNIELIEGDYEFEEDD